MMMHGSHHELSRKVNEVSRNARLGTVGIVYCEIESLQSFSETLVENIGPPGRNASAPSWKPKKSKMLAFKIQNR